MTPLLELLVTTPTPAGRLSMMEETHIQWRIFEYTHCVKAILFGFRPLAASLALSVYP